MNDETIHCATTWRAVFQDRRKSSDVGEMEYENRIQLCEYTMFLWLEMLLIWKQRESLTLDDISYDGRKLFYRLLLSEMFVPYSDSRAPYPQKAAFDLCNNGAGVNANNLQLGIYFLSRSRFLLCLADPSRLRLSRPYQILQHLHSYVCWRSYQSPQCRLLPWNWRCNPMETHNPFGVGHTTTQTIRATK